MGSPPKKKYLRKEDFDSQYHDLIDKLAFVVNPFMDEVVNLFNGNIDFTNINQQIVDYTISTDSSGNLVNPPSILVSLYTKPRGIVCINATNVNSPGTYPTTWPGISFTLKNNTTIDILDISGLQNSSQYILKLLIIG